MGSKSPFAKGDFIQGVIVVKLLEDLPENI
jgi:hypothetical protein